MFKWKQSISEEVFKTKYMVQGEKDIEEVFRKIAQEISSVEKENKSDWEDRFFHIMNNNYFIPAGRILSNARPDTKIKNYNNCFVIHIEDKIQSITNAIAEYMWILKQGGGVGFNISNLRPKGEKLSTGGESSGPLSFLEIFNTASKTIQVGGQRRGASICILNIDHPDIEEFITYKQGDSNKRLTQFNISVGITDEFIEAVKQDKEWKLKWGGKIYKTIKAKDLYDLITNNAFQYAEPGIFNIDHVNNNSPLNYLYKMDAVNPCFSGETEIPVINFNRKYITIKELYDYSAEFEVESCYYDIEKKKFISNISIARAIKNGEKQTVTIFLSNGTNFTCTPDHLLFLSTKKHKECYANPLVYIHAKDSLGKYLETNTFEDLQVVDIKDSGLKEVYDLVVPGNNCFYIHTLYDTKILVHNCGEVPLFADKDYYGSCNLGSLYLPSFVKDSFTDTVVFDWGLFINTTMTSVRFLDDVLDAMIAPLDKIDNEIKRSRRLGLGFTGLADCMARLKIKYGSEESKNFVNDLGIMLRAYSYLSSIKIAREKGPFKGFTKDYYNTIWFNNLPLDIQNQIKKYGIRNGTLNSIAPTGTISISVGQNCSSGIEPIFALEYQRKMRVGGENDTKIEQVFNNAYLDFITMFPNKEIPDYFITADKIDAKDEIDIQAIMQKYVDLSISKTCSLPKDYQYEDYKDLFMYAYDKGLKGFTSFWEGGSLSGILIRDAEEHKQVRPDFISRTYAPKRPEWLECDIHKVSINKEKHIVLVGKLNGTLYEMFVTNDPNDEIETSNYKRGVIVKRSKGKYDLVVQNGEEKVIVTDIAKVFDEEYGSLSRMISISLRHGVPLEYIIQQLQRDKNFIGFEKSVSRVLKKYIKNGEKVTTEKCPECGGTLIFQEGCVSCKDCGTFSKCG